MKRKIQNQFQIYFLLLSVLPLLILAGFSYYNIKVNAESKLYDSIQDNLKHEQTAYKELYSRFAKYMDIVSNSAEFYDVLHEVANNVRNDQLDVAQFNSLTGLDKLLTSMFVTDDDIAQAMIVVEGRCVYSYGSYFPVNMDLSDDELMKQLTEPVKLVWTGGVVNPFNVYPGTYTIVSRNIHSITSGNPSMGLCQFVLLINQTKLTENLEKSSLYPGDVIAVVDDRGQLLVINDDTPANRAKFSALASQLTTDAGQKEQAVVMRSGADVVTYFPMNISGWKIIQLTPVKYFADASSRIILLAALMILILLGAMFLFSWLITGKVIRPIKRLAGAMKKVGEKNFSISLPPQGDNEIGEIYRGFNDMVANIDSLFKLTIEKENQKRQYEMNMLRYQVNPHFLYNTLNSMRFAAIKQKDAALADMLMVLSRLLRNTLSRTGDEITLEQEITNIRDYLLLQQVRYDGRISVHYEIDSSTLDLSVPAMILQPLVENAIMHGLNEHLNSGSYSEIRITARIENDAVLTLMVVDNGGGIPEERLAALLEEGGQDSLNTAHIGLNNIHKRIRLQYGEAYGLSLNNPAEAGTCIKISLPILHAREETKS